MHAVYPKSAQVFVCLLLCYGLGLTLNTTVMVRFLISAVLEETG